MFTKEELLQKGISEDVADEIIAASEDEGSENSLQALEKAINSGPEQGELFKANGGKEKGEDDDDDDEGDYDESYMKKYMKRYMMANKKACGKMAKEVGIFGGEMKKAVEDIDLDAAGAVVEMIDLKPLMEKQGEVNDAMAKAVEELSGQMAFVTEQQEKMFDLMQKAAAVQVETAKGIGAFLDVPQGRKGVTASVDMQKATQYTPEMSKIAYTVLMKAVQNKDEKAGYVISAFESAGKNLARLTPVQRQYINDLIQKEEK